MGTAKPNGIAESIIARSACLTARITVPPPSANWTCSNLQPFTLGRNWFVSPATECKSQRAGHEFHENGLAMTWRIIEASRISFGSPPVKQAIYAVPIADKMRLLPQAGGAGMPTNGSRMPPWEFIGIACNNDVITNLCGNQEDVFRSEMAWDLLGAFSLYPGIRLRGQPGKQLQPVCELESVGALDRPHLPEEQSRRVGGCHARSFASSTRVRTIFVAHVLRHLCSRE